MKKVTALFMALIFVLNLSACVATQLGDAGEEPFQGPTWQEQYDLGVRYLSEGNYEGAILAFTAAIEIDPKQAPAYVGRGGAYVLSGETAENLSAAKADYEKAVELDETSAEAYLGLAQLYIRQKDYEKAREILIWGVDKTGDESLRGMLDSIFVEDTDIDGRNAYGATAFTLRAEYIPFVELTEEGQRFIAQATTAVMQNDRDALLALSETVASSLPIRLETSNRLLYTVWNQYKIGVGIDTAGLDSEGVYLHYIWDIEIRPQNDMGYYAYVWKTLGVDESKNSSGWYYEYHDITNIISCPCVDWQWNGSLSGQSLSNATQYMNIDQEHVDGTLREMQRNNYVTGQMKDSLRDGVFTVKYEDIDVYPGEERSNYYYESQYTETFNCGECVGHSEWYSGTKFVNSIDLYSIGDVSCNAKYSTCPKGYFW